jgi:glutathione synthase/RimK-type ligase-like ATP-grasp enzyme
MELPEPDVDEAPLAAALAAGGFDAQLVAWDDPHADWDAPLPTIIRSTWNYALHVDRFLAWIDRAARSGPLFNPPEVVGGNVYKRYLLELAARGVPVVPTTVVEPGQIIDLPERKLVIKPEVAGGSLGCRVFEAGDPAAGAHLAALTARGAALVQPYLHSVDGYGERSIVMIDGELSHAIRKTPRFEGDREKIDGPFAVADDEHAVAEAALAPYGDLLYARVDLARDADERPVVMELELVEPSLFFTRGAGSAVRYVAGLRRRLQGL